MKRGDLVTVAVSGDDGKPRPALVIQSDAFVDLPSVTVLRLSSEIIPAHLARITIQSTASNGLRVPSQVMLDKAVSVPRARVGRTFGRLDTSTMRAVNTALIAFFDLDEAAA
jgi:mRNA interferase MazF